jgi:hypothetical protein
MPPKVKHTAKHPGFAAVSAHISKKEGISLNRAHAIVASAARNAGHSALMKNPRIKRVAR